MKQKSLLLIAFILFLLKVNAQESIKLGVQAGLNFSKYTAADLDYNTGFNLGITAQKNLLNSPLYLSSGLFITKKGGKEDLTPDNLKINAYYLELPMHIGLKQRLSNSFTLYEEVGPYFSYGLYGKTKTDGYDGTLNYDGDSKKVHVDATSQNTFSYLKRFDMGVGLKIGIEFKNRYNLSMGADWGLLKVNSIRDTKAKNFNFSINLGYKF